MVYPPPQTKCPKTRTFLFGSEYFDKAAELSGRSSLPDVAPRLEKKVLNRKKVQQLRDMLTERGLDTKGTKPKLVHRLVEWQKTRDESE